MHITIERATGRVLATDNFHAPTATTLSIDLDTIDWLRARPDGSTQSALERMTLLPATGHIFIARDGAVTQLPN